MRTASYLCFLPLHPPLSPSDQREHMWFRDASTAMHASILCKNFSERHRKQLEKMCTYGYQLTKTIKQSMNTRINKIMNPVDTTKSKVNRSSLPNNQPEKL